MQQMSTKRTILCHFLAISVGLTIAMFLGLLLDRREPITIYNGKIEPYYVKDGMLVVVTWPLIENRSCAGELRRVIVDSSGKIHEFAVEPTIYHTVLSKDKRTFVKNMTMPYGMAPGPATYYGLGVRWCNVFQQFIWPIYFKSPGIPICVLPSDDEKAVPCVNREP